MKSALPPPPKIAAWLLRLAARGEDGFAVLGDFDEEYAELREARGGLRARLWYWRHSLRSRSSAVLRLRLLESHHVQKLPENRPAEHPEDRRATPSSISPDGPWG